MAALEALKDAFIISADLAKLIGVATGIGISAGNYPYFNQINSGNPTDSASARKTGKNIGLGIGATDMHDKWGKGGVNVRQKSQIVATNFQTTYQKYKKYSRTGRYNRNTKCNCVASRKRC